jgi:protocatechuate 4,5-dioxygenase, alpha chain
MSNSEEPDASGTLETYVFDGRRSHQGLPLNNMGLALNQEKERESFLADPEAFMERFGLSEPQKKAVRENDFIAMLELGGNIYFTYKIGAVAGLAIPDIMGTMTGQTSLEYVEMMKNGGRNPNG